MNKRVIFTFALICVIALCIVNVKPTLASSQGSWTSKSPLPKGRTELKAEAVNGRIYAIGGYVNLNVNEEYNPATDNWTTKSAMLTPRFAFAMAVYQNKIYCIGGFVGKEIGGPYVETSVTGAIEAYNPITDSWETKNPMPLPRAQLQANVVDDKIYLMGGRTGGKNSTVALNQVYDPLNESWITKAPMPYPVIKFASATAENKIYVIGGQDEFNDPSNLDVVQIYDTDADTWTLGTPIPTPVWLSAACTISDSGNSRIYLVGGQPIKTGSSTNIVQIYAPERDYWEVGPSMLTARFDLAIASVDNAIYALGGTDHYIFPGETVRAENEKYTLADETPQPSQTLSPTTPSLSPTQPPSQSASPSPSETLTPTPAVPEFPTWIIMPLAAAITLLVSTIKKTKNCFASNR
jgi:N-acetylneuraminic acid mutarotase